MARSRNGFCNRPPDADLVVRIIFEKGSSNKKGKKWEELTRAPYLAEVLPASLGRLVDSAVVDLVPVLRRIHAHHSMMHAPAARNSPVVPSASSGSHAR